MNQIIDKLFENESQKKKDAFVEYLFSNYPKTMKFFDKSKSMEDLCIEIFKNKDPKYISLIGQLLLKVKKEKDLFSYFYFFSVVSKVKVKILKNGKEVVEPINKDILFNYIKDLNFKPFSNVEKLTKTTIEKYLNLVTLNRFLKMSFCGETIDLSDLTDALILVKQYKEVAEESRFIKFMDRKFKTVKDMHDQISRRLNNASKCNEANIKDFDLNQREDILKLDNQKIKINGDELIIKVPKTRHHLIDFSELFDNCVGWDSFNYGERCRDGYISIVGIFKESKPVYCIETTKYSFKQCKGYGNTDVSRDIVIELESLLTVKPSLKKDFINMTHSSYVGYKYLPSKEEFYVIGQNGVIYVFCGISERVYERYMKSKNKITYFERYIRINKESAPDDFTLLNHNVLAGYKYVEETGELLLMFRKNKQVYAYLGVEKETFREFEETEEKMSFFSNRIKRDYKELIQKDE